MLKVFDNPLGVLSAESGRRGEGLGDGLAIGQVLNDRCTGSRRGGNDGDVDRVATVERDVIEIVRVVRVPLVPSYSTNEG